MLDIVLYSSAISDLLLSSVFFFLLFEQLLSTNHQNYITELMPTAKSSYVVL